MEFWTTLSDVLIVLTAAVGLALVLGRLRQSTLVGYVLAGMLLGPGGLHLMKNSQAVSAMAELGVAFLLFSIGLEFSWSGLRKMGRTALLAGALQIALTMALGAGIFMGSQASPQEATAIGAMLALSSTACVLPILRQRGELESIHGRQTVGILLVQDIAVVPLVLIVSSLGSGAAAATVAFSVGRAALLAALLLGALYLVGGRLLPLVLQRAARAEQRELPILLAIVSCLGAAWAAHALELSPALGAFVAGMLLAESPFAVQLRADVAALRTLFVTLFFVSIGMLADLGWMAAHWRAMAAAVATITIGKTLVVWPVMRALSKSHRSALATGLSLAHVGEFSFVLAQAALAAGLAQTDGVRLIVSATPITLLLTPYLVSLAPGLAAWTEKRLVRMGLASLPAPPASAGRPARAGHVIVIGCGPAGQQVVEALGGMGFPTVVLELNPRTVMAAKEKGIDAILGDATQGEVLEHLHPSAAEAVVVTLPDHRAAISAIGQVRAAAPGVRIIARSRYHNYADELRLAGADVVVDEEQQTGLLLAGEVLHLIDALPATRRPD